jgi:fructose PTS system EIIBC or EIIC component
MKVHELLSQDFVIPELKGRNKEDIINELIDLFKTDPRVMDLDKVRQSVIEREKIMSTGVGKGFAIPHGKTNSVNEILAAFGKTSKPVDYDALDNQPVNLVFLLVGKENLVSTHIKLLSRISRMMNKDDFRRSLAEAQTGSDILNIFRREEENYFDV